MLIYQVTKAGESVPEQNGSGLIFAFVVLERPSILDESGLQVKDLEWL